MKKLITMITVTAFAAAPLLAAAEDNAVAGSESRNCAIAAGSCEVQRAANFASAATYLALGIGLAAVLGAVIVGSNSGGTTGTTGTTGTH